jgi:trafficking protein particle complex subunit 2
MSTLTKFTVPLTQDLGLLHSISPRLATYGFLTNTNVKFVIVVDMLGRNSSPSSPDHDDSAEVDAQISAGGIVGLRDSDLKPAWKAIQSAWIGLLLNGFYTPDVGGRGRGGAEIKSRKFGRELERIGMAWYPGIATL